MHWLVKTEICRCSRSNLNCSGKEMKFVHVYCFHTAVTWICTQQRLDRNDSERLLMVFVSHGNNLFGILENLKLCVHVNEVGVTWPSWSLQTFLDYLRVEINIGVWADSYEYMLFLYYSGMELPATSSRQLPGIFHFTNDTISCVITVGHICVLICEQVQLDWKIETFLPPRRDCMKGDEMETKKIGGSVNLMVSHPWFVHFKSSGCFFFFSQFNYLFIFTFSTQRRFFLCDWNPEFLQVRGQQGGHVHPLHPQAVRPAPPSRGLHR